MNNHIGKSALGLKWQQKQYDQRLALAIFQKTDVSENLSRLLAAKNISLEEVENVGTDVLTNIGAPNIEEE